MRTTTWATLVLAATACADPSPDPDVAETDPIVDTDPGAVVDTDTDVLVDSDPVPDTDVALPDTDLVPARDYDHDGPVPFTVSRERVTRGNTSFKVTVYMPSTPGPHPVVSLSCGSSQTASGYLPHAQRLASHGIATVLIDDPGALVRTIDVVPNAVYVVGTWLGETYGDQVDLTRVGLAGHSRGGGVSLVAAERLGDEVVAWFGLDPVDNMFFLDAGVFAREDLPDLRIPTAFLGAEIGGNCAPAADGYPTLYPLAPSPSVLVVGLGAGHIQVQDVHHCNLCAICTPDGTADDDVVLAYTLRYLAAFFGRELLGDAGVGPAFEGVGVADDVAAGRVTVTSK